jgi:hypothetical protein
MLKNGVRGVLAVLVIGAAMFATLGEAESGGGGEGNGNGSTETTEASGATETTEATGAAASTQQTPFPLGTDVEVAAGWNLKVNSAELDGNATASGGNQFITPEPGNQFVVVNVTITNKSDQPGEPFINLKLSLLPPSGVAADSEIITSAPNQIDTTAQMQPGAAATGNVVFQVPSAEAAQSVLLGQSVFTLDEAKDQKFFAIQ